uniref:Phospholipase A2 n=1 Tax=Phascolarctos cinereus TaxID=38626 RepID=A0A6P5JCL1_PHACI|nr:calcium-dependent phospholipase A2-like [Phascolarctos cinereus]
MESPVLEGLSEVQGHFMTSQTMTITVMGRDAIADYNPYGCYCGQKGNGTPKDATDMCCWKQEHCYLHLERENCDTKQLTYRYRYRNGIASCGSGMYCEIQICTCDAAAALCMQKNRNIYNVEDRNYTVPVYREYT